MRCSAWVLDGQGQGRPCLVEDCQEHRLPEGVQPLPPHPTGCDDTRRLQTIETMLAEQRRRGIRPPTLRQQQALKRFLTNSRRTQ